MEDEQIVALYWERSEIAIAETKQKYNGYCSVIANNILNSKEETEECVSDTWLKAWNSMPPKKPSLLSLFLGKITRNLAINRARSLSAEKRGSGQLSLCLDELAECVGEGECVSEGMELRNALNSFLHTLKPDTRRVFMQRYWYMYSISEIADINSMSESAVKTSLSRTRAALKDYLEKEGIEI
ncbi:MAG: RNA polymerase sigma factor [Ruminiclostridium sp.]